MVCYAKALYDYASSNPEEELDLFEGDVIAVEYKVCQAARISLIRSTHPCLCPLSHRRCSVSSFCFLQADNGWWVGINHRTQRNGIFPGTYVEEIASPN